MADITAPTAASIIQPVDPQLGRLATGGSPNVANILMRLQQAKQGNQTQQYLGALDQTQQRQGSLGLADIVGKNQRGALEEAVKVATSPHASTEAFPFVAQATGADLSDPRIGLRSGSEIGKLIADAQQAAGAGRLSNVKAQTEGQPEFTGSGRTSGGAPTSYKITSRVGENPEQTIQRALGGKYGVGDIGIPQVFGELEDVNQRLNTWLVANHPDADTSAIEIIDNGDGTWSVKQNGEEKSRGTKEEIKEQVKGMTGG